MNQDKLHLSQDVRILFTYLIVGMFFPKRWIISIISTCVVFLGASALSEIQQKDNSVIQNINNSNLSLPSQSKAEPALVATIDNATSLDSENLPQQVRLLIATAFQEEFTNWEDYYERDIKKNMEVLTWGEINIVAGMKKEYISLVSYYPGGNHVLNEIVIGGGDLDGAYRKGIGIAFEKLIAFNQLFLISIKEHKVENGLMVDPYCNPTVDKNMRIDFSKSPCIMF